MCPVCVQLNTNFYRSVLSLPSRSANSHHANSPEQTKTFRRVISAEHERFKQDRGRPKKDEADKEKPITLRIEPSLLLWVKQVASNEGFPWQTYLMLLVKKGLEARSIEATSKK